jgi:hypothetical protein
MDQRHLRLTGSLPEVAIGLARARLEEETHARRNRRGGPQHDDDRGCSWRPFAIGLGLFVLLGWALTLLNRMNG